MLIACIHICRQTLVTFIDHTDAAAVYVCVRAYVRDGVRVMNMFTRMRARTHTHTQTHTQTAVAIVDLMDAASLPSVCVCVTNMGTRTRTHTHRRQWHL